MITICRMQTCTWRISNCNDRCTARSREWTFVSNMNLIKIGLVFMFVHPLATLGGINNEYKLKKALFANYDPTVRPVSDHRTSLPVYASVSPFQIVEVNEKRQYMVTKIWLYLKWFDASLKWNYTETNVSKIIVPVTHMWTPDIATYNSLDPVEIFSGLKIAVRPDGSASFVPDMFLKTGCTMDVSLFPFDSQSCNITMSPWVHSTNEMVISPFSSGSSELFDRENNQWDIVSVDSYYYNKSYTSGDFSFVETVIRLRRKPIFYVINIVCPAVLISLMSSLAFLLPAESDERVSVGLTTFLAFSVFMLMIAEKVPETHNIPIVSMLLGGLMMLNILQLTVSILSIRMSSRKSASKQETGHEQENGVYSTESATTKRKELDDSICKVLAISNYEETVESKPNSVKKIKSWKWVTDNVNCVIFVVFVMSTFVCLAVFMLVAHMLT